MKGWVYIITNKAMPDLIKVGFSSKDPELRAREFGGTHSPHPFIVEYEVLVNNPYKYEQLVHKELESYKENKEWFRCSLELGISTIRDVIGTELLAEDIKHINRQKIEEAIEQKEREVREAKIREDEKKIEERENAKKGLIRREVEKRRGMEKKRREEEAKRWWEEVQKHIEPIEELEELEEKNKTEQEKQKEKEKKKEKIWREYKERKEEEAIKEKIRRDEESAREAKRQEELKLEKERLRRQVDSATMAKINAFPYSLFSCIGLILMFFLWGVDKGAYLIISPFIFMADTTIWRYRVREAQRIRKRNGLIKVVPDYDDATALLTLLLVLVPYVAMNLFVE